jgi:ElaB/YqjD/DUF883 family membrane-anchored ribosome-binding protein
MRNDIRSESQKDPDELEREVDESRSHIYDTLNALEQRFSPSQIFDQVLNYTRSNSGEFSRNLVETVKANPVPALLTATGLAWMMAGQRNPGPHGSMSNASYGVDPAYRSSGDGKGKALKEKASHLRESGSHSVERAKQGMHQMGSSLQGMRGNMRGQASRASGSFEHMLREQPLAMGALGIALGALIGASVPQTRKEHEMFGEKRDELANKASQAAESSYEKARETGSRLAEDAKMEVERTTQQQSAESKGATPPH